VRIIVLVHDSSESPTYGEQEGSAYNGHFGCTCYHPLFVFNQFGDVEPCASVPPRSGNVHSADGWRAVLEPVIVRYQGMVRRLYFRGDAAFEESRDPRIPRSRSCVTADLSGNPDADHATAGAASTGVTGLGCCASAGRRRTVIFLNGTINMARSRSTINRAIMRESSIPKQANRPSRVTQTGRLNRKVQEGFIMQSEVRRVLRGFEPESDALIEEVDVSAIPLRELQKMFGNPEADPMYESQEVSEEIRQKIERRLVGQKIRKGLAWYLEAEAYA
jgi:hypothetical protein